jgi:hypothetical protein
MIFDLFQDTIDGRYWTLSFEFPTMPLSATEIFEYQPNKTTYVLFNNRMILLRIESKSRLR